MRHDAPLQQAASRQTLQTACPDARALVRAAHEAVRSHGTAEVRQRMTILHKCTEIHWFSSGHHVHFTIQESGTKTNLLKVESVEKELSRGWEELSRHVACGTVTFHNRGLMICVLARRRSTSRLILSLVKDAKGMGR